MCLPRAVPRRVLVMCWLPSCSLYATSYVVRVVASRGSSLRAFKAQRPCFLVCGRVRDRVRGACVTDDGSFVFVVFFKDTGQQPSSGPGSPRLRQTEHAVLQLWVSSCVQIAGPVPAGRERPGIVLGARRRRRRRRRTGRPCRLCVAGRAGHVGNDDGVPDVRVGLVGLVRAVVGPVVGVGARPVVVGARARHVGVRAGVERWTEQVPDGCVVCCVGVSYSARGRRGGWVRRGGRGGRERCM